MYIKAEAISKNFGGSTLFEKMTVDIHAGNHVAIVGNNGCGKTTLLKIFAGEEVADAGRIIKQKDSVIGFLHQIPYYPQWKVSDVLYEAFQSITALQQQMTALEQQMATTSDLDKLLVKYGELQELFEAQDGYALASKVASIANGLGIASLVDESFEQLSGGEKTKVTLGKILLQEPDILLLDEPTNHLDLQAIEWLENYIKQFKGTVVIVSHDRQFMNQAVDKIIEIEDGQAWVSHGNYDHFLQEKEDKFTREFAQYEEQQKKIKKMRDSIRRLRQWANEASPPNPDLFRKAKTMERMLERLEKVKKPTVQKKMNLQLEAAGRSGKEVAQFKAVNKSYERPLLENINFTLYWQQSLAIIGANGAGKSTIIKMLLGEECPDAGTIQIGSSVKIGYLAQHMIQADSEARLIDVFREEIMMTEPEARHILAQFLFYGHDVYKKVKNMSGGERMRLKLAQFMQQDINLLVLDEPTNHLDIESREVLEDNLEQFEGTIIAISHDRYFLEKLFGRIAWLEFNTMTIHEGNYDWAKEKQAIVREAIEEQNRLSQLQTNEIKEQQTRSYTIEEKIERIEKKMAITTTLEELDRLEKQLEQLYDCL
ncbi:ribosomal protection-like ABC-F family protein [Kurthia sibirica]|uniref:ABC transporter ATP-binding protein n=1 Tax=Kurthia sibirica TaxID=202750 RepID=A0A2U3APV0_9BACL|nr:ABC-F type ribosomal protection protein [Kurthia sibirica]PWI26536.1 ABC transporter ATP-binding protein [Kurthia sibirica]GEK32781.1 ABC transporter ATP-binding protein [Kurthia sibirica]